MIRRRHTRVRGLSVLALIIQMLGGAGTVIAAEESATTLVGMSGSTAVDADWTIEGACDTCIPDDIAGIVYSNSATYGAKVKAKVHLSNMTWSSNAAIEVSYDDQLLRQGAMLDLVDKLAVIGGTMTATRRDHHEELGHRAGRAATMVQDFGSFSKDLTLSWTCPVPLPGESPRGCTSGNANTTVFDLKIFSVTIADVYLRLKVGVSLTSESSTTSIAASADMAFIGSGQPTESEVVRLVRPVALHDDRLAPPVVRHRRRKRRHVSIHRRIDDRRQPPGGAHPEAFIGDLLVEPEVGPDIATPDIEFRSLSLAAIPVTMGLSGGNSSILELGQLAKNNVPPKANAGGGLFHLSLRKSGRTDHVRRLRQLERVRLPDPALGLQRRRRRLRGEPAAHVPGQWEVLGAVDGHRRDRPDEHADVQHPGRQRRPAAVAGPNTTAAWGRNVAFNGAGQDPGADDQPTLTYVWEFGDGSPSASGGASTTHAYANPGSYTATLTVCDRGALCDTDTRTITVRKRDVSLGSLGDTSSTHDTASTRRASLVDEYGTAVNGRSVSFTVDGAAAGSGVTNSDGRAQVAWTPALAAGSYATGAAFAGDSHYTAATGSGSVAIAKKATSLESHRSEDRRAEQDGHAQCGGQGRHGHAARRPGRRLLPRQPDRERGDERLRRRHRQPEAHPEERVLPADRHVDAGRRRRGPVHRECRLDDVQAAVEVAPGAAPRGRGCAARPFPTLWEPRTDPIRRPSRMAASSSKRRSNPSRRRGSARPRR